MVLLGLAGGSAACAPSQVPGHTSTGLSRSRQQCVECGLRDGAAASSDPLAAAQFRDWCRAGDPASCSALGVMYETGRGVKPNPARAEKLYQRACRDGNGSACVNLGRMLSSRHAHHQDLDAAKLMFEMACMQGDLEGCFELGKQHYEQGRSAEAAAVLQRGCGAQHAASCETLGVLYAYGMGVSRDIARAGELFRSACLGGRPSACERLGRLSRPSRQHASRDRSSAIR